MKELDNILSGLITSDFEFHFITNSISMSFTSVIHPNEKYFIWIEPFWRIIKDQTIVLSSLNCPWHEEFADESEYNSAFEFWCSKASYLKLIQISNIKRLSKVNDLLIEWSDETRFESIQNNENECSWYLENPQLNKKYNSFSNHIMIESTVR